jgi:hypothetical protein
VDGGRGVRVGGGLGWLAMECSDVGGGGIPREKGCY